MFGPVRPGAGELPSAFRVLPPQPNPSRGPVRVEFELPTVSAVRVTVHDVQGRLLETLLDRELTAGRYPLTWSGTVNGQRAPVGVYFMRFQAAGQSWVGRIVLAR